MRQHDNSNVGVQFISMREASKITGINPQTLRILADQNKVKSYKTVSGQRKFDKNFLEQMCNNNKSNKNLENTDNLKKKKKSIDDTKNKIKEQEQEQEQEREQDQKRWDTAGRSERKFFGDEFAGSANQPDECFD